MLPTEDSLWVAGELSRRFGLQYWQLALTPRTPTASPPPRASRHRAPQIFVYNYCYHGSVDETIITINDGVPGPKPGNAGPPVDPTLTTKVIEWNDLSARPGLTWRRGLVLVEPALTNIGIILPDERYHAEPAPDDPGPARCWSSTRRTRSAPAPGAAPRAWGLEPDMVTLGKPIGSGVPAAVYGFGEAIADVIHS